MAQLETLSISFNGNKIITTGAECITNSSKLAKQAKYLLTTAIDDKFNYRRWNRYNFRLSNIQSAIGIAQIKNKFFLKKKKNFS